MAAIVIEADFAVALEQYENVPDRLRAMPLIQGTLVCVVRAAHPGYGDRISTEQFSGATHLYNSEFQSDLRFRISEWSSYADLWFKQQGIKRKIAATMAAYLPAAMITSRTDYLMTIPRRVALKLVEVFELRIVAPPADFPGFQFNLVWHPMYENEPAHTWLRGQLFDIANALSG